MITKTYQVGSDKSLVSFVYKPVFKKWEFTLNNGVSLIQACGGREKAEKVARVVSGALKRKGELDNLGRSAISKIVAA